MMPRLVLLCPLTRQRYVHTHRYCCIPSRFMFEPRVCRCGGVWHGRECAFGLPTSYPPAMTIVVPRSYDSWFGYIFSSLSWRYRTWRNSADVHNWKDFAFTLRAAAALAHDMGLSSEQAVWSGRPPGGSLCSGFSAVLP